MDGEKGRDLRRGSGKRLLRALSGHIAPSLSVLGNNIINGDGGDGGEGLERLGGMWISSNKGDGEISGSGTGSGSEGDEGSLTRPPATIVTANILNSRKKPKLQAKALEDCNTIDPAMVPRRLRSAINKRNSQSASPPLSDAKKRHQQASSGAQVSNTNGSKKLKQVMLSDPFTKEEEEVAETLSSLASVALLVTPVIDTENGKLSEENSEAKAMSAALADSMGEDAKSFPCNINELTTNLSLKETEKAGPSMLEPPITVSGSQKFKPDMNGTAQGITQGTALSSGNEQMDHLTMRDALDASKHTQASVHLHSGNGSLQPAQFDGSPSCNLKNGLWQFGSVTGENTLQSFKQQTDNSSPNVHQLDISPNVRPGLLTGDQGHSTKSSSSKAAICPDTPSASSARPNSSRKIAPAEKLPPLSIDKKQPWKKCAIHLHISHLIKNHQNVEKRCMFSFPQGKLDIKEGAGSSAQLASGSVGPRNGLTSLALSGTDSSIVERNMHEPRTHMLQDKRFLQVQQASTGALSGAYPQPKPGCDFSSTSSTGDNINPGNSVKLHGQYPVPFQVQHHTMFPFPFPHGPYTAAYPDQLAAVANQQMQLQLPHYMSSPLYGSHMVHPGAAVKHQHQHQHHHHHQQQQQQQQIWQAHMAHYRPPKWQNGRPHDSSPSLLPSGQASSTTAPEVPIGAAYHHPPHQHQFLSIPLPMTAPSSSRQPQLESGGFRPEGPTPMQLLCNVQHM